MTDQPIRRYPDELREQAETDMLAVLPGEPEPDDTPSRRAGLRDEIAAALYERERPPRDPVWSDAYNMDREVFGAMADAVLALLYREWPWLRAEAEDADGTGEPCGHLSPDTLLTRPPATCTRPAGHEDHADERGVRWHTAPAPTATEATGTESCPRTTPNNSTTSSDSPDNALRDRLSRVIALNERWVKAGPPPLGVLINRWWDARLVELHNAIQPPAGEPARTTPNNPPGSTREQLPGTILTAIRSVLGKYYSTACHTATACQASAYRHAELADELRVQAGRLHSRCRLNQKFTGQLCVCGCHTEKESSP